MHNFIAQSLSHTRIPKINEAKNRKNNIRTGTLVTLAKNNVTENLMTINGVKTSVATTGATKTKTINHGCNHSPQPPDST
ncbi:unnamed protein product [Macrosiphum euphorbiae]|uniref:Uncharacterized protein n=1 Tax=Macrosiphum euphorbiae TaxID=13131 RepID=A0AAV0XGD0_9HEMI|nr:unnamed protein product [Macrosiphum euphorbiae]